MFKFQIGSFGVNIENLNLSTGEVTIHVLGQVSENAVNIHFSNKVQEDHPKVALVVEIWSNVIEKKSASS